MDVRGKLVELLTEFYGFDPMYYGVDALAITQHLISHGVTVQEWIPAEEPPEEYRDEYGELIPFLVCEEGTDYPFRAMYDGKTWGDGIFAIPVKWWMHLPAPPKEMDELVEDDER